MQEDSLKKLIFERAITVVIGIVLGAILLESYGWIKDFAKGKLRPGQPAFVYKCEYIEEFKGEKTGLWGLTKEPSQWLYCLSFANLTRKHITNIDISCKLGRDYAAVYVKPIGCQINIKPKIPIIENQFTLVDKSIDRFNMLASELSGGRSASCFIHIFSNDRPSLADFEISLNCAAGNFQKITSFEWNEIGWQKVQN